MSERYALLLIDHGSRRAEANTLIERVAEMIRERIASDRIVEHAHMELAEPTIDRGFAKCVERGATVVVAHPFMLAPGRHVREDVPRLLAEAAANHPGTKYLLSDPLGAHPAIADIVLDRFEGALAGDEAKE
ncbi:MAG: CbiX/SirB N-terminal domain-containing protein [Myxococcota bacterium]